MNSLNFKWSEDRSAFSFEGAPVWLEYRVACLLSKDVKSAGVLEEDENFIRLLLNETEGIFLNVLDETVFRFFKYCDEMGYECADNPAEKPMRIKDILGMPRVELRKSYEIREMMFFSPRGGRVVVSLTLNTGWFDVSDKAVFGFSYSHKQLVSIGCLVYQQTSGAHFNDVELLEMKQNERQELSCIRLEQW